MAVKILIFPFSEIHLQYVKFFEFKKFQAFENALIKMGFFFNVKTNFLWQGRTGG